MEQITNRVAAIVRMTNDTQEVVEEVDELLQNALNNANVYCEHDEVRPSAIRAFDLIEEARLELDKIDEREFVDD